MSEQKENKDFVVNELCWAKIKGYPWWPAIIRDYFIQNNKKIFFVEYFCEKNGSELNENNIKKWKDNFEIFKDGGGNNKKDFFAALTVANMYYEGKIDSKDHQNFLDKYQRNKDRHNLYNIEIFFKNIIKEKIEKDNKLNEKKVNELRSSRKKLLGKKRAFKDKIKNEEKINDNKRKISLMTDKEINMHQKDLNKIDDLIKNITDNVDQILVKNEKYQKFFEQECKEKNIAIHDNKSIKTKIELIKYLQIINEVLYFPITLNNMIQNINSKK